MIHRWNHRTLTQQGGYMNSSNLMAGVLVVGAILPSAEAPHYCQYNKAANPVRANRKSIPVRISVSKSER